MVIRVALALLLVAFPNLLVATAADKPVPKDDAVTRDLKALEGTWEVVTHEVKGKKASDAGYATLQKIVIAAGKMDLFETEAILPIVIDPAKTPKAMDIYIIGAMKFKAHLKGIYALDGDDLKICLPLSMESDRPAKFSSEDFHSLYVLRRKK